MAGENDAPTTEDRDGPTQLLSFGITGHQARPFRGSSMENVVYLSWASRSLSPLANGFWRWVGWPRRSGTAGTPRDLRDHVGRIAMRLAPPYEVSAPQLGGPHQQSRRSFLVISSPRANIVGQCRAGLLLA